MTQKWKAKEKTLGTKHSVLKIFIFEKFSNVDRWLLQKPSADLVLGLSRTEFVKWHFPVLETFHARLFLCRNNIGELKRNAYLAQVPGHCKNANNNSNSNYIKTRQPKGCFLVVPRENHRGGSSGDSVTSQNI